MNDKEIINIDSLVQGQSNNAPQEVTNNPTTEQTEVLIPEVKEDDSKSYIRQDAFGNNTYSMIERVHY